MINVHNTRQYDVAGATSIGTSEASLIQAFEPYNIYIYIISLQM